MDIELSRLAEILEQEIAAGEELSRNLAAQKQAIIDWDVERLLREIEAREPQLQALAELENRRRLVLAEIRSPQGPPTARRLIAGLPPESPERARLSGLRERTRRTFSRLQADEWTLHRVMENIFCHIQEAFGSMTAPSVPLYGETGAPAAQRASSAFLRSKA